MIDLSTLGLALDGSADTTAAINAALATGDDVIGPAGDYRITDKLCMARPGQRLHLGGVHRSRLLVDAAAGFNMGASAIIEVANIYGGADLRDFTIMCAQPDTAQRNELVPYPSAIKIINSPRGKIEGVQICAAITGVDMAGTNSGGTRMRDLQLGCLGIGLDIDNALDFVFVDNCEFWVFGLSANLMTLFESPSTTGLRSGRCDGLLLTNCGFFVGQGMQLYSSVNGSTFGNMVGGGFDGFSGVLNHGCNWFNFAGTYWTPAAPPYSVGVCSDGPGFLGLSSPVLFGQLDNAPFIVNNHPNSFINVTGGYFQSIAGDRNHVQNVQGHVIVNGNHFDRAPGKNYGLQTIEQFGGTVTAIGNRQNARNPGDVCHFVYLSGGDRHQIHDNDAQGAAYFGPGYTSPGPNTRISNNT